MSTSPLGYIICETASSEPAKPNIITVKNDRAQIEACIQDINKTNRNKRYYASNELVPRLEDPRIKELIRTGNLYGEAGHPSSNELTRQQVIDPNNMSHLFKKIWVDDNKIMSNISAANTNVGDNFNRVILSGDTLVSFSLRALGSIQNTKNGAEVKNIRIITWDWVVFPSHQAAYMSKIIDPVVENKIRESGNMLYMNENASGIYLPIDKKNVTDYVKSQSNNLKRVVESFEYLYTNISIHESGNFVDMVGVDGSKLRIHLERHIKNEIMDYCSSK